MRRVLFAYLLLTALFPNSSTSEVLRIEDLPGPTTTLIKMMSFVAEKTGMDLVEAPQIFFGQIPELSAGEVMGIWPGSAVGAYDPISASIMLPPAWSWSLLLDQSIVIHELVHHFFNMNGHTLCPREAEELAYKTQLEYLNANSDHRIRMDPALEAAINALPCDP